MKGVKEIKHVKSIYFDIFITKSIIKNHFGYATILPPGGDGAKEVIAFNAEYSNIFEYNFISYNDE